MKTKLEKLRKAKNRSDLAKLLGYKPKSLAYLLYKMPDDEKYHVFEIPKKNGGTRIIESPNPKLKLLQRRVLELLSSTYDEILQSKEGYKINQNNKTISYAKSISHGFRKNHSIMTNASKHRNRRYVFNIDLKDFFPSINFGRVRGYFINNKYYRLNNEVATILAQIICFNNKLPQGSPCSPIVSNMIGHILDIKMVKISKEKKCVYSRYADDLTFSTNMKNFPKDIAKKNIFGNWKIGRKLKKEIKYAGFNINDKKTVMQFKTNRQIVTGLVVNKKVNIRKEYYRKARSMCNELFKNNSFYYDYDKRRTKGNLKELEGILGYIYQVKNFEKNRTNQKNITNQSGIANLYKKFLIYKFFYSNEKSVIITEGVTDPIYIKSSFKKYKEEYDFLYDKKDKAINFTFFHFKDQKRKVFDIASGTSGIKNLILEYENSMKYYRSDGLNYPVIIVLDNDSGANAIKNIMKSKYKISDIEANKFNRLVLNLYVVFVVEEENSAIEDLFDEDVLSKRIGKKHFNKKNDMNSEKEYGKVVFANKVIRPNIGNINFAGFLPFIKRIGDILNDYEKVKNKIFKEHKNKVVRENERTR